MSNSSTHSAENQTMIIQTTNRNFTIVNYYCPNNMNLNIQNINVKSENFIIVGDFNSHSQSWGYNHMDNRGVEIEDWQDENNLTLINRPNDAPTSYSRVWHTTSTPDIALCTEDLHRIIEREVGNQLGGSDHRPVYLTIAAKTVSAPVLPR